MVLVDGFGAIVRYGWYMGSDEVLLATLYAWPSHLRRILGFVIS